MLRRLKAIARKIGGVLGTNDLQRELGAFRADFQDLRTRSVDSQVTQLLLRELYRRQFQEGALPLPFHEVEFRCHSQNGEDGILLYLFAAIGTTNRRAVEICAGDGQQCNTANLILNHGWSALLFEGDPSLAESARAFYRKHPATFSFPPKVIETWIVRDTINQTIRDAGFTGEIDLLSLDLDGVDYWIWEAIEVIRPRVVVAEIQAIWGAERAVTVPYRDDFQSPLMDGFGIYSGASLPAFVKLAKRKGYRLVGTQALGFNAFFVRDDIAQDRFPAVTAEAALDVPFVAWARETYLPRVRDREWVEV